ncbi:MAG: peptidylprolyl isomerase [Bacteroidales bacterium]|nr:peptidylprolyl isomerase [Bacteroidales bacterium]
MKKLIFSFFLLASCMHQATVFAQDPNTPDEKILDRVIAVVGNEAVLQSEVEEQYFQLQARGMSAAEDEKCKIFEGILFQKMLIVQAQIDSVEVSEKEVEAQVDGRIRQFSNQIGGDKQLEDYFGKTIAEIKESFMDPIREQLIAQKMQSEITGDVKITPSEVKSYFSEIPKDSLPIIDATFEMSQIVIKPQMTAAEKQAQRDKLNAIRERIVTNGEDFKTLAVLYSDDPGSAKLGGLMSGVSRGDLVPEFASAVFNLELNEVSDIVETEYGIHVIKLIDKQGDKVDFRHILLMPQVSAEAKYKAKEKLDSIANVIRTDTLTFEQAAIKFSEDENTRLNGGKMVNPYTGTDQWEAKYIEPSINFALRDLKVGEISDAFEAKEQGGPSSYKIIFLKNKTKAHTVNMKDDYQMIQDMALNEKKQNEMMRWVTEKQKETYIKIEGKYKNCKFDSPGWIK